MELKPDKSLVSTTVLDGREMTMRGTWEIDANKITTRAEGPDGEQVTTGTLQEGYLKLTSGGDQELDVDYCTFWGGGDGIDVSRNTSSSSRELRVYVNRSVFGELNTGVRDSYSYFTYAVQFQTFSENVYWDTTAYTPTSPTSATGNLAYDGLLADPENDDFEPDTRRERLLMTYNPRGFLRRVK